MKLKDVIHGLLTPDTLDPPRHFDEAGLMGLEVEFCTAGDDGMDLLSVYICEGKICVDIGH